MLLFQQFVHGPVWIVNVTTVIRQASEAPKSTATYALAYRETVTA